MNVISIQDYGRAMQRLREDEERLGQEITRLKGSLNQLGQNMETLQRFASTLKDFDTLWPKLTLDEQKHILRTIIRQIRAGEGRVEIDFAM